MIPFRTCLLILLILGNLLPGCASSMSGDVYSRDEARGIQTVSSGQVVMVREVLIEGTKSPWGTLMGGAMGAALGSAVGSGSGQRMATVGGAIAGGLAGSAVEEGVTRQKGLEITVRLHSGEQVAVVQAADVPFQAGDIVRILRRADGKARVVHE